MALIFYFLYKNEWSYTYKPHQDTNPAGDRSRFCTKTLLLSVTIGDMYDFYTCL